MTDKEQQEDEARSLLDRLGTERKKLEARLDDIQKETHDAIVNVLMARTLGPSEVARRVQYDRQHVARIAKKAGVPPLREATVVSRAKAAAKDPQPATAAPRQQVTRAAGAPKPLRSQPEPRDGRPLTDEEAAALAALGRSRASDMQLKKLEQNAEMVGDAYKDYTTVNTAMSMGLLTHDEVYGTNDEEPTA